MFPQFICYHMNMNWEHAFVFDVALTLMFGFALGCHAVSLRQRANRREQRTGSKTANRITRLDLELKNVLVYGVSLGVVISCITGMLAGLQGFRP